MVPMRLWNVVCGLLCLFTALIPGALQAAGPEWQIIAQVEHEKDIDLMQFGSDGSKIQLTNTGFAGAPSVSPDGRSLFFSEVPSVEEGAESLIQIFKMDLQTKLITRISDGTANDDLPACSADGKQLAFTCRTNESMDWLLHIMDVDGKNRRPVEFAGKSNTVFPCWSPDGIKIVYFQPSLYVFAGLYIADLQRKTTTSFLPFWFKFINFANWSPQGDKIAFADWSPLTKKATIWVAKPDGSDRRKLTEGPEDKHPSWYPDGRKLIFARKEAAKSAICSVDLETLEVRELVASQKEIFNYPKLLPQPPSK